jgi:hypothetical protein
MCTWFDEERGERSGRVVVPDAPAGSRVFVLGALEGAAPALVGPGDFAEVRQIVDLTGFDLVGATFDTVGQILSPLQGRSGWPTHDGALLRWALDQPLGPVPSEVLDRWPLVPQGDLVPDVETYSPEQSYCRRIPVGSSAAALIGVSTPFPADPLPAWTLEWWQDWVGYPTISGSSGFSAVIFYLLETLTGLRVRLQGVAGPGAHEWYFDVRVRGGGPTFSADLDPFRLDGPGGWTLFSLVVDTTLPSPDAVRLYANGVLVANGVGVPPDLLMPPVGTPCSYGSPSLQSRIDQIRMLPRALSPAEVLESWQQCTTLPPAVALDWNMKLLIDGVLLAERTVAPAERRRWTDFLAPCRAFAGPHEVAFRLALDAA